MMIPLITEFELNQSGVRKLIEYFDNRLIKLREQNDNYKAHRSTRGRIAEIKDFQKIINPNTKPEASNINDAMNS